MHIVNPGYCLPTCMPSQSVDLSQPPARAALPRPIPCHDPSPTRIPHDASCSTACHPALPLCARLPMAPQGFHPSDFDMLKKVPIKLGGGRVTLPLADLLPAACVADLERICDDYARN